jgi:ATP-binding cassette, subfamily G (WHITE), member 2
LGGTGKGGCGPADAATGAALAADTLLGTLSVYEMLLYTAELKCPTSESLESKKERVETLVASLGLTSCR